jgi:predicted DNA-binding protein
MGTQILITLPDEVYQRAQQVAQRTNQDIAIMLADTIQRTIPTTKIDYFGTEPISTLSDLRVLALTELQMDPTQDQKLSELLDRQQAGTLIEGQLIELKHLMEIYQKGLIRKASALSEAVQRGIMEPLG